MARLWLLYLLGIAAALASFDALRGACGSGPSVARLVGGWWALPLLLLAGGLAAALLRRRAGDRPPLLRRALALGAALLSLVALEVVAIHALGLADQRGRADAVLVLGARVYEDGTPSEALSERVATAVALHRQGLVPALLVSGATGREGHDEALVMKQLAVRMGVPPQAIHVDSQGYNTEASVKNARAWLEGSGGRRMLVVSHYHHLPRVRLLGQVHGLSLATVPADEGATLLAGTPFYVVREAAALAYYYLRG